MRAVVLLHATWQPPLVKSTATLTSPGRRVGRAGRGAGGAGSGVPVVVLGDDAAGHRDQAVLVAALAGREDRLAAQRRPPGTGLAAAVDDDVHAGVGVVGDRDRAAAGRGGRPDQGGCGAAALAHLPRLLPGAAVVGPAPGDARRARPDVEAVEGVRGDDEDAAGLVHREAVGDRLGRRQAEAAHGSRGRDEADDAGLRDEPGAACPVRQRALDAGPARDGAQVDVADEPEALAVGPVLGDGQQVPGERGDDRAVLVVEVEVAAPGEVVEGEAARLAGGELVGRERRQRRGVEHPEGGAGGGDAHRRPGARAGRRSPTRTRRRTGCWSPARRARADRRCCRRRSGRRRRGCCCARWRPCAGCAGPTAVRTGAPPPEHPCWRARRGRAGPTGSARPVCSPPGPRWGPAARSSRPGRGPCGSRKVECMTRQRATGSGATADNQVSPVSPSV